MILSTHSTTIFCPSCGKNHLKSGPVTPSSSTSSSASSIKSSLNSPLSNQSFQSLVKFIDEELGDENLYDGNVDIIKIMKMMELYQPKREEFDTFIHFDPHK